MASFGRLNLNSDVITKDKTLQYLKMFKDANPGRFNQVIHNVASKNTITSDLNNSPFKRFDSNRLINLNNQQPDKISTPHLFSEIDDNNKPNAERGSDFDDVD